MFIWDWISSCPFFMPIFEADYPLMIMAEVFYDISHLTTDQLRELFTSYRKQGWIDYEYEFLDENNPPIQPLSDADIILNIQAGYQKNHFVFMLNHEDEEDGVMISFTLNYHEDFSAYLHLPPKYLPELIEKYALVSKATNVENITVEQYLIEQAKGFPMN
jgi:hypothetical protein